MMSSFISIPLKRTNEVDLAKPVASFIASTYSSSDRPTDTEAVNELNKLRNKAVCTPLDRHESSLEVLYRYYDQLVAVEAKLPLTPTQIPIPFKWKDAFDKGSLFFGKASLTLSSGSYEKACVLFNIAALQSQIGAVQSVDTDEELKVAAKMFQQSAGVLTYLKESVLSLVQQEPTIDLMPDTLCALAAVMLAQAQESIYLKAAKDSMKPQIVAKIAAQCADFFQEAHRQMNRDLVKGVWDREWLTILNGKQYAFQALAQYQQSLVNKEQKEIGAELARLQDAQQKMQQAQRIFEGKLYQSQAQTINKGYELAKKDNDFIYHERIPDLKTLPVISKAAVAKALPVNNPMGARFKDLFESLVPVAVHQALAAYDVRKAEIVNGEIGRMREQTQLMNAVLASMNLPAAIEDVCNQDALPESVREKSSRVRNAGGIQALEKMQGELPGLLKRNREILEETSRVLTEEKNTDDQLRAQHKERWTRMPSEKLTEPLWQEVGKYKGILDTAMGADGIVKQKFETNRRGFEILSKPEGEVKASIPGLGDSGGNKNSPSVNKLKELMREVEGIRAERDELEKELKDKSFDMTSCFLQALGESGVVNEEQLSLEKLNEIYGPIRTTVSESLQKQERVMQQVQDANGRFCHEKSGDTTGAERENMLKMLAVSHDAYMELRSNLQEGTKFYNDLTPLLVRLQQKVSDFGFARKTEMEDLMKDLQQNAGSSQPPPRPPPPTVQTQQGTQQASVPQPQQTYGTNPFGPTTETPVPPPRAHQQAQAAAPQAQASAPAGASAAPPTTSPYPVYNQQYQPYPGYAGQAAPNNPYPSYPYPPTFMGGAQQGQAQAPYPTTAPYPMAAPMAPTGYNPYAAYTQPQPYGQQPQQPYPQQQQQTGYQQYPYPQQQWR